MKKSFKLSVLWFLFLSLFLMLPSHASVPSPNWTDLNPASPPSARFGAAMAFDPVNEVSILFGGQEVPGQVPFNDTLNDTWSYNGTTNVWTLLIPLGDPNSPPSTFGSCMVYDPLTQKMILVGGANSINGTWSYDVLTNTWTHLTISGDEPPYYWSSMAFEPTMQKMILFGGTTGGQQPSNQTFSFDTLTNTWALLTPTTSPGARNKACMTFDPLSNRLILFGGQYFNRPDEETFYTDLNDTWTYDPIGNTWIQLIAQDDPSSPPIRDLATMSFNPLLNQIILFAGLQNNTTVLNDTWAFDGNAILWTQLQPATSPSPRSGPCMTLDAGLNKNIVFGGGNGANFTLNDTWAFVIESSPEITSASQAAFLAGVPSCFTITTTGYPFASLSLTGQLPSGIEFVDNGDGTATLCGVALLGSEGVYSVMIIASNGVLPDALQNFTLFITPIETRMLLSSFPNPSLVREPVLFQADVNASFATGTVTFYHKKKILGTAPVNGGVALLVTTFSKHGKYLITARYSGDDMFLASTSSSHMQIVKKTSSPTDAKGCRQIERSDEGIVMINRIKWKASKNGSAIVSYHIYRDKEGEKLVKSISANQALKFKEKLQVLNKGYDYYIVSVNAFGDLSRPVFVKF